jgi:hypothetical protein
LPESDELVVVKGTDGDGSIFIGSRDDEVYVLGAKAYVAGSGVGVEMKSETIAVFAKLLYQTDINDDCLSAYNTSNEEIQDRHLLMSTCMPSVQSNELRVDQITIAAEWLRGGQLH